MTADEVITWFAFQCPETKREYFYEPISGEKTWALPTSKRISNTQKTATVKHQVVSEPQPISDRQGEKMGLNTNQPTKLGFVIAMTLAVSLICNTVFLVVLVKLTGPHHTLQQGPVSSIPAVPGDKHTNISLSDLYKIQDDLEAVAEITVEEAPEKFKSSAAERMGSGEIEINEDAKESKPQENLHQEQRVVNDVKDVVEEVPTTQNFQSSQNEHKQSTSNNDEVDDNVYESVVTVDAPVQEAAKHDAKEKGNDKMEGSQNQVSSNVPPQCWVPFAYVVNPGCRRKELQKPMFDAEQFVRAMI